MAIGVITGSGNYALPGFEDAEVDEVRTPFGSARVSSGQFHGVELLHISRHGPGHARLSSQVEHRANIWALNELGASAVIGCSICGAVDPSLELGSLIVFDDLHFISNRLPDGSLCSFFVEPDDPGRGHWILHGSPLSDGVRAALLAAAAEAGHQARDGGTYGHVDGPRFNTPIEIAQLAACGVTAVSQTAGPEVVLCGELELPYGLVGFVTDYANEVLPGATTPVAELIELMGASRAVFVERRHQGGRAARARTPDGRRNDVQVRAGLTGLARLVDLPRPRAVVVMARAPGAAPGADPLAAVLGAERVVALRRLLLARAVAWAERVAPGSVQVAYEPTDAGGELRALVGVRATAFPQNGAGLSGRLANASVLALRGGGGPLLIAWPDLSGWRAEHAEAALTDLGDGLELAVGPVFDGGFYLIALSRPLPALFGLPDPVWRSPDALALAFAAAHRAGIEAGMLRAERGLHSPEDVRAALADPLLDPELRRLLGSEP